ncbi:MAG: hypothetical protein JWR26_430 [Pedosphaera sp.]|nr:hypothetical protein [Pedosphaera sp.]
MKMRAYRYGLISRRSLVEWGRHLWLSRYASSRRSDSKWHSMWRGGRSIAGKRQGTGQKGYIYGVVHGERMAGCVLFMDTGCLLGIGRRGFGRVWGLKECGRGCWRGSWGQKYLLSKAGDFPIYSWKCTFFGVRVNRIYPEMHVRNRTEQN